MNLFKKNLTTLCYIEKDEKYLMLHRIKKENEINKDKWIGIGGHFELGESPEECLIYPTINIVESVAVRYTTAREANESRIHVG